MTKEIAQKETSSDLITTEQAALLSQFAGETQKTELIPSQVVYPRIAVLQKMSPILTDKEFKALDLEPGDLFDYGENKVLFKKGQEFKFIPVFIKSYKREERQEGSEWVGTGVVTNITALNDSEAWDYEKKDADGKSLGAHRAKPQMQVFLFTPSQLGEIRTTRPYILTLKGTSMKYAGKELFSNIMFNQFKSPLYSRIYTLKVEDDSFGKLEWCVSKINPRTEFIPADYLNKDTLEALKDWNDGISKLTDVKTIGDEEHEAPSSRPAQNNTQTQF